MNRPTGVTVIAILSFLGTVLLVILGCFVLLGGALVGAMIGSAAQANGGSAAGAGVGAMLGLIGAVFFFIAAALQLLCGIGLWKLKEWGRMLTIVLHAIGLVIALYSLIHPHLFTMFFFLIRLGVSGLIIWYLSQPHIKAAFAQPQLPPQPYAPR